MSEQAKGSIVIEFFLTGDPKVTFLGEVSGGEFNQMQYFIRMAYAENYIAPRAAEERKNQAQAILEAKARKVEEDLIKKAKEAKIAADVKAAEDKALAAKLEHQLQVKKENTRLEAERILKREQERLVKIEGDQSAVEKAKEIIETLNKENENAEG